MTNIDDTLNERGSVYGSFRDIARTSQMLKNTVRSSDNWDSLTTDMQESIDMVLHKMARILHGDPRHHDSWHDMIGYLMLVERTLTDPNPSETNRGGRA